jgi:hypothetical protein
MHEEAVEGNHILKKIRIRLSVPLIDEIVHNLPEYHNDTRQTQGWQTIQQYPFLNRVIMG